MHIKDLAEIYLKRGAVNLHEKLEDLPVPVALDVDLHVPVWGAEQLVDGVKQIKDTAWYRVLKRRGFRFVPALSGKGTIMLVVGTAVTIGTAYTGYKVLRAQASRKASSPQSGERPGH